MHTADYCPLNNMVVTGTSGLDSYALQCEDSNLESSTKAEYFGIDSRCIITNGPRPLCMKTECNKDLNKVIIMIKDGEYFVSVICQNDGDIIDIPGMDGMTFECPPLPIICPK